jgi:probable HAF family extracellular repeat protein
MKSRELTYIAAMTLFAALAMPVRPPAQEQTGEEHHAKQHRYKLVDIRTFGGPISLIHPLAGGSPNPINSRGTTVGGAATAMHSPPNSFLCGLTMGFVSHAFEWQKGVVTDLGTFPGADNCSVATSINENGEIAGYSENGQIDPLVGLKEVRAVRWKDGEIKDLGTFGGNGSGVAQINNRGQIAGVALNAIPDPFSLIYLFNFGSSNGTQARAFLWQDGELQDLGTLGGPDANAFGLNERGQVTGILIRLRILLPEFPRRTRSFGRSTRE